MLLSLKVKVRFIGLFQKKSKHGGLKLRWNFSFFTLSLEIPDRKMLNPWIFHKIVLDLLEIARAKPWKFHYFIFNEPLQIPHAISLIPLEIPYPQSPVWIFQE